MRKYFIAAAVAVAVFAMSAFAASLTVDGGVLQAGADDALTCGENADVTYATQTTETAEFAVNEITVTFSEGCNTNFAYVATFSSPTTQTGFGIQQIAENKVTFTVDSANADALVENIDSVSVLVKNTDDGTLPSGIITG